MKPDYLDSIFFSGKATETVLLQCALYWAELGETVWFISPKRFNTLPSALSQPPDKEILKLIIFIYVPEIKDLLTKLNEVHLWTKIPRTIIISGIEHYWSPNNKELDLSIAAYLSATLIDAASIYGVKNSVCGYLIIAYGKTIVNNQKLQTIVDLYFSDNIFQIVEHKNDTFDDIIKIFQR